MASTSLWVPARQSQTVAAELNPVWLLALSDSISCQPLLTHFGQGTSAFLLLLVSRYFWHRLTLGLCLHFSLSVMLFLLSCYSRWPFFGSLNSFPCFIFLLSTYVHLPYYLLSCLFIASTSPPPPVQCKLLENNSFSLSCSLLNPQGLGRCLVCSRHSIHAHWIQEWLWMDFFRF